MYYLMIWDVDMAANGEEGCLSKIAIPTVIAKFFMHLDSTKFPSLSALSFDDYDLFSGVQLESLIHELNDAANINPKFLESITAMMNMVFEAQSLGKKILFDPFRKK